MTRHRGDDADELDDAPMLDEGAWNALLDIAVEVVEEAGPLVVELPDQDPDR